MYCRIRPRLHTTLRRHGAGRFDRRRRTGPTSFRGTASGRRSRVQRTESRVWKAVRHRLGELSTPDLRAPMANASICTTEQTLVAIGRVELAAA